MNKPRLTSNYWAYFLAEYLNQRVKNNRVTENDTAQILQKVKAKNPEEKWICSFIARAVENYFYRFDLVHNELNFSHSEKVYSSWGITVHTLLDYSMNYTLKLAKQLDLFQDFNLNQLLAILGKSRSMYHALGQKYRSGNDTLSLAWQLGTKKELLKLLKSQYSPSFLFTLLGLLPVKDIRFFQKYYLEPGETRHTPSEEFIENYQTRHLRVNLLKISRDELIAKLVKSQIQAEKSPYNTWGIHLKGIYNLYQDSSYQDRLYELQDDATQLAVQFIDPHPGTRVLDYYAGNGSKTLGYAVCMNNKGTILATDNNEFMVQEVKLRARNADVSNIQTLTRKELMNEKPDQFDTVITDVPCTGTGNLEKHPEKRIHFSMNQLRDLTDLQTNIIEEAAAYVAPGGQLVYITSSLLREENGNVINKFLEHNKNFEQYLPENTQKRFPHFITSRNTLSTIKFMPHMQGVFVTFLRRIEE